MSSIHRGISMETEDYGSDEEDLDDGASAVSDLSMYSELSELHNRPPFKVITADEVVGKMNVEIKQLYELLHVSFYQNSNK